MGHFGAQNKRQQAAMLARILLRVRGIVA